MRISTDSKSSSQKTPAAASQAIITVGHVGDGSSEKKNKDKLEVKAVESKDIFQLAPYVESIQKNTLTTVDLSEKKDPGYHCQKETVIQDLQIQPHYNDSFFGSSKISHMVESKNVSYRSGVWQLGMLPNGHLVTLSREGVVRIWDVKTGECIKNLNLVMLDYKLWFEIERLDRYMHFAVLSNGQLATALTPKPYMSSRRLTKSERIVSIWDINTSKRVAQLKSKDYTTEHAGVLCLRGLPDEQLLVLGIKGFEIWDVKKQKILFSIERKYLGEENLNQTYPDFLPYQGALQILPNGIILGYQGKTIDVWNKTTKSLKQVKVYDNVSNLDCRCYPMAILPDGRIALPHWIRVNKGKIDSECDSIDKRYYEDFCTINRKERESGYYLFIGIYDQEYRHVDNFTPIEFYPGRCPQLLQLLTLQNGHLLSVTTDNRIQIWNTTTRDCVNTLEYPGGIAKTEKEYELVSLIQLLDGRLVTGGAGVRRENPDRTLRFWESGGPLQLRTIEPLLIALKANTSVTTLNLQNTAVDDNIISFIVELWKTNSTLKKIDLRNTKVTVEALRNPFQLARSQAHLSAPTGKKEDDLELLELIQHPAIEVIKAEKREAEVKAKAKAEADERARKEAEIKAKAAAEAAEKARKEAEIKAKMEAAERAYQEEQAKIKAAAEAAEKLRKEQELKAKQEAEEKRRQEENQKQLQELHKKGEQGDITAQLDLANRYETGNDVTKDPQLALSWYKKAAEQGNDIAQHKLGEIFEKGLAGKKDYSQAYFWYQKAADQGNDAACAGLKSLKDKGYSPPTSADLKATSTSDKSPVGGPSGPVTKEAKADMSSAVSFEINYDQLTFGKELGRGGFGVVYQGTWRFNNVAIKQLLTKSLSAEALDEFNSESRIMAQLRSEYVVQFYGRCVSPTYCLVMQYMPKGSLFNLLRSSESLDWSMRHRMITEIASGLAFLHASNIFHRDLKSLNVLLDEHYRTKLCDFGLSKVKKENQSTATLGGPVGTIPWMAPELFERRATFTAKADIYSLAMTLWEIASRKTPFADASNPSLISVWVAQGQREEIPSDTPLKISSLIRCCWHQDPAKRPTAAEVVTYLRSDQVEFKSTESVLGSSATTSIQGNLVSSTGSDLDSSGIRANLMSGSMS